MKNIKLTKLFVIPAVTLSLGLAAFGASKIDYSKVTGANAGAQVENVNVAARKSLHNSNRYNYYKNSVQATPKTTTNTTNNTATNSTNTSTNSTVNTQNTATNSTSTQNTTSNTTNNTTTNTQSSVANDKFIAEIEQLIFNKVNQERAKAGVSQLSYNSTMEHYARIKSQDMGDRGYFDHKNPEGKYMSDIMKADGVNYMAWGENIAYIGGVTGNSTLADNFMTNWMNSPGHRANILSTNYSSIGVGVYKIGDTYYATQEFYK
ncbi:CAP domain-containing protein [Inconstantimicrobium mannanitabidum]|uniref:Uncharacterized protein n=1 Tax=Inconstantimicrobium mannanitabidum TaxID=1604901 RepID=A0ACB5R880_9CLOT|nr:CAP domain-containing protein [Clostridium sp. TW13]GKX65079.1 hypothetical protein rsdtw13_03370 [Clostridium sp. TW13]